jgi:hypothetical protein
MNTKSIPSVAVTYACNGATMRSNELDYRRLPVDYRDIDYRDRLP